MIPWLAATSITFSSCVIRLREKEAATQFLPRASGSSRTSCLSLRLARSRRRRKYVILFIGCGGQQTSKIDFLWISRDVKAIINKFATILAPEGRHRMRWRGDCAQQIIDDQFLSKEEKRKQSCDFAKTEPARKPEAY